MSEMQIESPEGEILTNPGGEAAPVEEPEPEQVVEETVAAAEITDGKGRKTTMVPLPELLDERKERRAATEEANRLRQELDVARRHGADIDALRAQIQALTPKASAVPAVTDADAEATAMRYGIYDIEGKPDLKAGRAIFADQNTRIDSRAKEIAQAEMKPIREMTIKQQANYLKQGAIQKVTAEKLCLPETLQEVLNNMSDEQVANADVVNVAITMAAGVDAMRGRSPRAAVQAVVRQELPEPLHTEASSRRSLTPGPLSDIEKRAAKVAGMDDTQWKEHTKNYEHGKPVRLE